MNRRYVGGRTVVGSVIVVTGMLLGGHARTVEAHCQIPCGIYDDPARITRLLEDATTIGKSVDLIRELSGKHGAQSVNQVVRWTMNKEDHASHIITVVSEYFLAQRVKPVAPGDDGRDEYLKRLADHHAVIVAAMKTKQHADPATVEALRAAIEKMGKYYR